MTARQIKKGEKDLKKFNGIIKGIDVEKKTMDVIVSNESVDRDQEVILLSAFKKRLKHFKAHGPLLSSHNYGGLQNQIGTVNSIKITKDGLLAKVEYFADMGNKEADWAFVLAQKGVSAFSIGFIPFDWENHDEKHFQKTGVWRTFKDVEMIELSQVTVPSNREAVQQLGAENPEQKELCELVCKSVSDDEFKKFEEVETKSLDAVSCETKLKIKELGDKVDLALKKEDFINFSNALTKSFKDTLSKFKEDFQKSFIEQKSNDIYKNIIFGDGGENLKPELGEKEMKLIKEISDDVLNN